MDVNWRYKKRYMQLGLLMVLRSIVQLEQIIPKRSILLRLQISASFKCSWSVWLLVCICFAVSSMHCSSSTVLFLSLWSALLLNYFNTALSVLPFLTPRRKKHLDVEIDWFAVLYTGNRNITDFSEPVKYLWECLLTVRHYIKKRKYHVATLIE